MSYVCRVGRFWLRAIALLRARGHSVHPQQVLECPDCRDVVITCRCASGG